MKSVHVSGISVIICDIEGTTTPISFVKNILFGYIRSHLQEFIDKHQDEAWMNEYPKDLEKEILNLMQSDSKVSWLKDFQGKMWDSGYECGVLKGQVYPDVERNWKKWTKDFTVGIYSSGSIHAQKLLFTYSEMGNLQQYLSFHFDTTNAGPKTISDSYTFISKQLGVNPSCILFLSDSILEIEAATKAGFKAIRVDRENIYNSGNVINNFDALYFTKSRKRKQDHLFLER